MARVVNSITGQTEDWLVPIYNINHTNPLGNVVGTTFNMDVVNDVFMKPNPIEIELPRRYEIHKVACGAMHALFLAKGGRCTKLYAVGSNMSCQLGIGSSQPSFTSVPTEVRFQEHARSVFFFICSNEEMSFLFDQVALSGKVLEDVAAGSHHSLLADSEGDLYSWGMNRDGRLGLGEAQENEEGNGFIMTPTRVPFNPIVIKVAAAEDFSILLTKNQTVHAFGVNYQEDPVYTPSEIDLSRAVDGHRIVNILDMDVGNSHGCLLAEIAPVPQELDPEPRDIPADQAGVPDGQQD